MRATPSTCCACRAPSVTAPSPSRFSFPTVDTWEAWKHPEQFHVHGEVVIGVPNDGSAPMMNIVGGAIVMLFRGGDVPFVTKIRHAQEAGAAAVIIVDSGDCSEDFRCGRMLGNKADGYLAANDDRDKWRDIFIPGVMITQSQGTRLQSLMETTSVDMDELGVQVYVVPE